MWRLLCLVWLEWLQLAIASRHLSWLWGFGDDWGACRLRSLAQTRIVRR